MFLWRNKIFFFSVCRTVLIQNIRTQRPGPDVIKLYSCTTQLRMKFSLLINRKMPTTVGIFLFISRENFMLSKVSKKEFVIVNNLGFISRTNFMLT